MENKDSEISLAEDAQDTPCDVNGLGFTMEPNSLGDTLSDFWESHEPFLVTDPEPSNSFHEPNISRTDAIVDHINSIGLTEYSEPRSNDGKGSSRFDHAFGNTNFKTKNSSTRRSTRKSTSKQKCDTKVAARKSRRTSGKKPKLDLLSADVGRRRRSDLVPRARLSAWGLGGRIDEIFKQSAEKNVDANEHIESRKGRAGHRGGKRNTEIMNQGIQNSQGEPRPVNTGLLLKFKLGTKVIQNCQFNTIPDMDEGLESYREVKTEASMSKRDTKDNYEKELTHASMSRASNVNLDKGMVSSKASVIDMFLADRRRSEDLVGKAGIEVHDITVLGELVENRCSDPGTSPDSEVINVIPDAQICGTIAEGLHGMQISSKDSISHQSGDCGVGSGISSPEIVNDVLLCDNLEHSEKQIVGSWSVGASVSTTTGVASSMEGCPIKPLASLQGTLVGASTDTLTIESGVKTDIDIVGIESVESRFSQKLLSSEKTDGQNLRESSSSRGTTKSMLGVSDSVNKSSTNFLQKGSQAKSTAKEKMKEKSGNDQEDCDIERHPVTGIHEMNDVRGLTEGSRSTAGAYNSNMVPSERESHQKLPQSAWVCCDDCHKWRRISAVLADTIESTECRWICKDNADKVFADCSIPQEKSNAEINEELELSDASGEEDVCNTRSNSSHPGQKQLIDPPQLAWKLIKTNMFLHRNRKNQPIDEIMVCHCKPPLDGRMGCGDECLNRMLNIECVKGTCPCGEFCSNQQFQKRKYSKLKCFPCGRKGFGLQLQEDISEGRFLIEYVGEVLDMPAYEGRQREYASKGHKHFYFMTLNGSEVIDACAKGNLGRFINHSCEPNCRTEKWMVNGEVCIGLFAVRDIKKGEELTFDYNYVRVFGAAAKRCVCGSSRCRGVIGGDPLNAETVVLGDSDDECAEPVTFYEHSGDKLDNLISKITNFEGTGTESFEPTTKIEGLVMDTHAVAASPDSLLVIDDKNEDPAISVKSPGKLQLRKSSAALASESKIDDTEGLLTSDKSNDENGEISSPVAPDHRLVEKDVKGSLSIEERTNTLLDASVNLLSDNVDSKKKSKSHISEKKCIVLKPQSRSKLPSPSSSVKRGKSKTHGLSTFKPPEIDSKPLAVPQKPKTIGDDSLTGRFEAVQEALNTLLNADGGISKRRDGWKGYLKLLYLTAHGEKGEGIQSNRDLSMILDALLKTKSRTVLLDIINKNGLQMLHILMKRYRKVFNKIPILRKLLKVLEFLAETKVLTLENILKPSPNGRAESFKESILSFTEHADKQVHQIARNFRDRFIPWSARKVNRTERDIENKRFPVQHGRSDRGRRLSEVKDVRHNPPVDSRTVESSSPSCLSSRTDGARIRKRKSRWDQPGDIESPSNKEHTSKSASIAEVNDPTHIVREEGKTNNDDMDVDAPPGFSSPANRQLPSTETSTSTDHSYRKVVAGLPQERFISQLSTAFGIPCSVLKRVGTPEDAAAESWVVAPAMTFHPFPPLPKFPPNRDNTVAPHVKEQLWRNPADMQFNQPGFQRFRNSNTLGRRYYKQQKWSNSRSGLPWNSKYGHPGFMGPNQGNIGLGYGGDEADGTYNTGNGYYPGHPHY